MDNIEKLVKGIPLTKNELIYELYEICDNNHSSCNNACPVYRLNGSKCVNDPPKPFKENRGCDCFKSGDAMYDFIKAH